MPAPETRILAGVGSAPVSSLLAEIPPEKPGWGGGLLAGYGTNGPAGSLLVVSPTVFGDHVFGIGELTAGNATVFQIGFVWRP
jgi:hypothetical protein